MLTATDCEDYSIDFIRKWLKTESQSDSEIDTKCDIAMRQKQAQRAKKKNNETWSVM